MGAIEVPYTLEYKGGQLNAAPVLEVENFTNWKKRKPENQWTRDERKAVNLDQRLKSLIMFVLPDDQMNFVINCLTAKSTWDDLIPRSSGSGSYSGSFSALQDRNRRIRSGSIYETKKNKSFVSATPLSTAFFSSSIVQDFQDSLDDEEDTRSSHEYLNGLEEEYQAIALLAKSKSFFKKGTQSSSQHKPELRPTKDFESKYNKVKAKLALLSSSSSASKAFMVKNKGLIAEAYEWDEEEMSSDDNEMVEVKVLMALAEENDAVNKEGARNGEWVKISMRKVHTLLEMEDNDDRKVCLDYLCIDLNYVEEQRSNLLSKHRNLVHELNACKEQLLKRILGVDQLTEDPSSSWLKDLVFVKSSANDTKVTILGFERPWLSEAEGFIMPNHDTATDYNSTDESSVCSTPLPPLKKLDGTEPISRTKTIKLILRSKSTFKVDALKGVIINEPSSAPAKDNKNPSASKVHSAPAGKLKSVKIKDDPPLAIVMK
ncbi:hypothetical protein Tco_0422042 [Tanacetum coccineum]